MESTKVIKIRDIEQDLSFRIRLFDAESGLNFIDKSIGKINGEVLSIKPFLEDLLPLCSLLDVNGSNVVLERMSLKDCYAIFKNPLAILELGMEVFKFQEVFIESSEIFRPYLPTLQGMFNRKVSE